MSAACAARLAAAEGALGPEANPGLQVVYRGACVLPDSVPAADGTAVPLTGLSGITWVGGDRYVAVLDNSCIVIRFRLALAPNGSPLEARAFEVVTLAERHDYEDVAPRLGGGGGVFVCEEDTPAVRAFRLPDGTADGEVVLPGAMRGMRPNRGPEALALDPDGLHLWTANEEALAADVGSPGSAANSIVRIARLPLDRGGTPLQVAYRVDPPHDFVPVAAGESLSGLVALVALGRGRLLVLERSAGPGLPPFESRLYLVDASRSVDVSRVERGLADRPEAVVGKTLLWSDALGMNLEGLCLGPKLAASRRALVGIADNGGLRTPTQVTGLELVAVTSP